MQFTIGNSAVTLEFTDKSDYAAVANQVLENETVKAAIKEHAASFYFRAWDNDGDIDQSVIDHVVSIALEKGVEAAVEYMVENDWPRDPYFYFNSCEGEASTMTLFRDFFKQFAIEAGFDDDQDDDFQGAVKEVLCDAVREALPDTDKSTPDMAFGPRDTSRVAFVQGYERGAINEIHTDCVGNVFSTETVRPDMNLMLQFKLMNISPVDFVEYYKTKRGIDLLQPEFGDVSDYERKQYLENAAAWRYACDVFKGADVSEAELPYWLEPDSRAADMAVVVRSCKDIDRPAAVSLDTFEEILDNATYGGVATWYGYLDVRGIMRGEYESSFAIKGGQIGVHDYLNGSGHIVSAEDEVLIDLRDGKLVGDATYRSNPESVHGFTSRALECDTRGVTVSDWVRFNENGWRSAAVGGLYSEITLARGGSASGDKVFLITTKDARNSVAGPLESYEVHGSLEDAKNEAMDQLGQFSPSMPKAPAPGM